MSVLFNLAFRAADRERAGWVLYDWRTTWQGSRDEIGAAPRAIVDLGNIGSGSALAIRVVGVGCHATIFVEGKAQWGVYHNPLKFVPAVAPGETIKVSVDCAADAWATAYVAVVWTPTPRVFRRRAIWRLPLTELGDPPVPTHRVDGERGSKVEVALSAEEFASFTKRPASEPQLVMPRGLRQRWATWQTVKRYR